MLTSQMINLTRIKTENSLNSEKDQQKIVSVFI